MTTCPIHDKDYMTTNGHPDWCMKCYANKQRAEYKKAPLMIKLFINLEDITRHLLG